jgi:hypothetical protein
VVARLLDTEKVPCSIHGMVIPSPDGSLSGDPVSR